jgi:ABC-type sugar transport system ATPase subunit
MLISRISDDVVIALMGVTGAGKSTFIKTITGYEDIQIGHNLTSGEFRALEQSRVSNHFSIR